MNSRLQQFLELEDLTPARLADILGVQRSGVSHILSGRNKPGYDFINKLLSKFPTISADWLITGKGKPYKEMNAASANLENTNNKLNNQQLDNKYSTSKQYNNNQYNNQPLSSQPILDKNEDIPYLVDDFYTDTLFSSINSKTEDKNKGALNTDNKDINYINTTSQLNENQINGSKVDSIRKKKSVKRVIIFYSDGSFDEMFPQ